MDVDNLKTRRSSYDVRESALLSNQLNDFCEDLLGREEELWEVTREDPLNADLLFQYRQVSLELYDKQCSWLQERYSVLHSLTDNDDETTTNNQLKPLTTRILEKHGKQIMVRSNATFARLNEMIGEYAKRVLAARDSYKSVVEGKLIAIHIDYNYD